MIAEMEEELQHPHARYSHVSHTILPNSEEQAALRIAMNKGNSPTKSSLRDQVAEHLAVIAENFECSETYLNTLQERIMCRAMSMSMSIESGSQRPGIEPYSRLRISKDRLLGKSQDVTVFAEY